LNFEVIPSEIKTFEDPTLNFEKLKASGNKGKSHTNTPLYSDRLVHPTNFTLIDIHGILD
jgi:hypothetical protein